MLLRKLLIGVLLAGTVVALLPFLQSELDRRGRIAAGRDLASVYCAGCHLEPAPEILPKRSWEAALGYMGYWLGMENLDYLAEHPSFARENVRSRREVLMRDGFLPGTPALSEDEWETLRYYYVESAPSTALPQTGKPALRWELPQFEVVSSEYRIRGAVTTLVRIREELGEIYLGDSVSQILTVLDGVGRLKVTAKRFSPGISPVDIEFVGDTAYVGSIGDLMSNAPSEARLAHIMALELRDGSLEGASSSMVLANLYRMADMKAVDLNQDGRLDFIVCGFGGLTGSVSWFESQPGGGYVEHPLLDLPGAVRCETHDFNADGLLDVAVLASNAREGLHILLNRGGNEFEDRTIFETHAAYGHTYFELQDFNGDGLMDLLVVNGDNVDSDPYNTRKNYHGIRIYLNRGGLRFEEAYFYPMYGAFIAKAGDFDQDGDLDIAAISFYPDYSSERRESFVYLENLGELEFRAFTNEATMNGRWMTMDIGDIDGDGDIDVVLGGSYIPVGMFAYMDVFGQLLETGPSVLILKNTLH